MLFGCGSEEQSAGLSVEEMQQLSVQSEAFTGKAIAQLLTDTSAMATGNQLYVAHCSSCHGSDALGSKGVPNLIDGVFDFGSSEDAIRQTISQGRQSIMPDLGTTLGEVDLGLLVGYVMTFSGGDLNEDYVQSARRLYDDNCLTCHGESGQGNNELGIPDLTDEYWQHGESKMNVRLNVTRGIDSECPPHADSLSDIEIDLITAYVLGAREGGQP